MKNSTRVRDISVFQLKDKQPMIVKSRKHEMYNFFQAKLCEGFKL